MLLTHQKREVSRPLLNMACMIDVVFLLLIFFMCTSSFKGAEKDLPTRLPRIAPEVASVQNDFDPIRIHVGQAPDGVLLTCDGKVCASFDYLTGYLAIRRKIADLPTIIEGDPSVPFHYMVTALDSCYRANLRQVAFSADRIGK